jgi:hypothetical protein
MVAIPGSPEEFISESKDKNVLDHLFPEVVVNAEKLILLPVWLQSLL